MMLAALLLVSSLVIYSLLQRPAGGRAGVGGVPNFVLSKPANARLDLCASAGQDTTQAAPARLLEELDSFL